VSSSDRKALFDAFWALADYDAQNYNLLQNIVLLPKKSQKIRNDNDKTKPHPKKFSRQYKLNNVVVCKEVFEKTYGISSGRISRLLKKKSESVVVPTDQRGKHHNHRGVSSEMKQSLSKLIDKIPKYKSHYKEVSDARYLSPGLRKVDVYELWKSECLEQKMDAIPSYEWFVQYWKENFDLKLHKPATDTCSTCDELQNLRKFDDLKTHHIKAKKAREEFKNDASQSHTLSFNMQKTMPLPHLHTSKVFYLRQLWMYNLGIHHTSTKQGHMFCWTEGLAKRGSNEIGSCLKKFIYENCKEWPRIILWSDGCGGQNKNINILSLFLHIVNDPSIKVQEIVLTFMWSGHSYLPNDVDFSHIERKKKNAIAITNPMQYMSLMKSAKKQRPFNVYQMRKDDFLNISQLATNFQKPKLDDQNRPIKFQRIHEMTFKRGLIGYQYRYCFNDSESTRTVTLQKKRTSKATISTLPILYPDGVPISVQKYQNLQQLLKYIPPVDHEFYKCLKHDGSVCEDIHPDE